MTVAAEPFRVGIVGAGAMGSLFGARLAASGCEIHLVVRRESEAAQIRRQGLRVTSVVGREMPGDLVVAPASVTAAGNGGPAPCAGACDLVMVMVKAYDTAGAAPAVLSLLGGQTLVLTLQNGLGNAETLVSNGIHPSRLLCGVTTQGASLVGVGHTLHAGGEETLIGWFAGDGRAGLRANAAGRALAALGAAGFQVRMCDPIVPWLWAKLVINVAINPVSALLGAPNGRLPLLPGVEGVMRAALDEACAVASASGVDLPFTDPWERVLSVVRATAANRSSMLQDVERGRPTEIEAICGEVRRRGAPLGVPTPVNSCLAALVSALVQVRTG